MNYIAIDLEDFVLFDVTGCNIDLSDNPLAFDFRQDIDSQNLSALGDKPKIPVLYRTFNSETEPTKMVPFSFHIL